MQIVSKETVIENWPVVKTRYEGRITKVGGGTWTMYIYTYIFIYCIALALGFLG